MMELIGNHEDQLVENAVFLRILRIGLLINAVVKIRKPVEDYS